MVIATVSAATRSFCRSVPLRNAASKLASHSKPSRSPFGSTTKNPLSHRIFKCPVELSACVESMQPRHTATASALMISKLTVSRCGYGWIFEDM